MSAHLSSDQTLRRAPRRSADAPRRAPARKKAATGPSRNSLAGDFLAICELDPAVETVRSPATPARFVVGGRESSYVADYEIVRDGVPVLVDIATDADLARHPLREILVGGAADAVDGRRLVVETSATLRTEPRLSTVKLVMACRHTHVSAGDRVRILHHLDECGSAPLVECAGTVQNARDGVAAVLALAVEGLVEIDIDRPILPQTPVRRRRLAYA